MLLVFGSVAEALLTNDEHDEQYGNEASEAADDHSKQGLPCAGPSSYDSVAARETGEQYPANEATKTIDDHAENCPADSSSVNNQKDSYAKPGRRCCYCGASVGGGKLSRHIFSVHANIAEVKYHKSLSSRSRREFITKCRRQGMFNQNKLDLNSGVRGNLAVERKGKSLKSRNNSSLSFCSKCKGFFVKKYFSHHKCVLSTPSKGRGKKINVTTFDPEQKDDLFAEQIMSKLRNDDIAKVVRGDYLIQAIGRSKFDPRSEKKIAVNLGVRKIMRSLANLKMKFNKKYQTDLSLYELLTRKEQHKLFDVVDEDCYVKKIYNHDKKLATFWNLKSACKILQGYFFMNNDDFKAEELKKSELCLSMRWQKDLKHSNNMALKSRAQRLRQPKELPLESEMNDLKLENSLEIDKILTNKSYNTKAGYIMLRRLTYCRLVLFNGRRVNEPSSLTIEHINSAFANEWIGERDLNKLSDKQKKCIQDLYIAYINAKDARTLVSIIIPKDLKVAIKILASTTTRQKVGVHNSNPFLFVSPNKISSNNPISGYHEVHYLVKNKKNITSTKLRHFLATILEETSNNKTTKDLWYDHMGHSGSVDKNNYQCPAALRTLLHVGAFLQRQDVNKGV